jgi:transmembrane sensor
MTFKMANENASAGDDPILLAAADWFLRLFDCTPEERPALQQALQEWIDTAPAHAEALARVVDAWDGVGHHATTPEMMWLRQAALRDVQSVVASRWRAPRGLRRMMAAAAAVAFIVVGVAAHVTWRVPGTVYATNIGERRAIVLADGSQVDIDAQSEISVDFKPEFRLVHLTHGRAYFQVAKDVGRPFIVEAGGRQVVATGTAFDVELLDRGMRVNLVEGQVLVREASASAPSTRQTTAQLSPGQQLVALARVAPVIRNTNVSNATSWRQGRLIFDDEPLPNAIAQVERYSHVRIVLAQDSLSSVRVSGVFNAGDVSAFIGALHKYFAVDTEIESPEKIVLTRVN